MSPTIGLWALFIAFWRMYSIWERGRDPGGTTVVSDGEAVKVKVNRGKSGSVTGVAASFALPGDLRFTFRKEQFIDRIAKSLHIAKELQTSDVPFDGHVFVESEDPALNDALTLRPALRDRIFDLLRSTLAYEVSANRGRIWLRAYGYSNWKGEKKEYLYPRVAEDFLPGVRALRTELAQIGGRGTEQVRDHTRVMRGWVSVAIVLCVVAGIVGLVLDANRWEEQVVVEAIPRGAVFIALGVSAAFLLVLFTPLRSTAFTHRVLFDILFAVVPSAWVAATGGLLYYNQAFDQSVVARVGVPVERTFTRVKKKHTTFYVVVKSWPDERGLRGVKVGEQLYMAANDSHCIGAIWRTGRLGDGWYERLEPADVASCELTVE